MVQISVGNDAFGEELKVFYWKYRLTLFVYLLKEFMLFLLRFLMCFSLLMTFLLMFHFNNLLNNLF
jgi:hypothetical protein